MSRADMGSKAPRPSRRRGGRLRLKVDEQSLLDAVICGTWLRLIEATVGEHSMQEGLLAARDGAVRSLSVEAGVISGPVQADAESSLAVQITMPVIDEMGWAKLIEAMACEAIWAAKLLEDEVPAGLEDLFQGCGMPLIPEQAHLETTVEKGGPRDGWRVAALAWLAAERLYRDPLCMLGVRGMECATLIERLGHHRALRTQGEAVSHPPIVLDPNIATGPPLAECLDTWWRPHGRLPEVPSEPHVSHALLRRLGSSTLEGQFPLAGLLATIYDEAAAEAARILDAPLNGGESGSA
ncbi:MAG: hypothetical protein QGI75_01190 [Phycisphaerales bacterium]|nr:hypothetical protein [Phycisphaerales bacterium]MDP6890477.1 hypothetical protein [Phycisphaerales bacterium]